AHNQPGRRAPDNVPLPDVPGDRQRALGHVDDGVPVSLVKTRFSFHGAERAQACIVQCVSGLAGAASVGERLLKAPRPSAVATAPQRHSDCLIEKLTTSSEKLDRPRYMF